MLTGPKSVAAAPHDFGRMYDLQTLEHVQDVYGRNLSNILFHDIHAYLDSDQQEALSKVTLDVPLYDANKDPFTFYMIPATGHMTIPALSMKFLDDVSIARAWMESNHCDTQAIHDYVAMAYYGREQLPPLLQALNLPDNVLDDPMVDEMA